MSPRRMAAHAFTATANGSADVSTIENERPAKAAV